MITLEKQADQSEEEFARIRGLATELAQAAGLNFHGQRNMELFKSDDDGMTFGPVREWFTLSEGPIE